MGLVQCRRTQCSGFVAAASSEIESPVAPDTPYPVRGPSVRGRRRIGATWPDTARPMTGSGPLIWPGPIAAAAVDGCRAATFGTEALPDPIRPGPRQAHHWLAGHLRPKRTPAKLKGSRSMNRAFVSTLAAASLVVVLSAPALGGASPGSIATSQAQAQTQELPSARRTRMSPPGTPSGPRRSPPPS